MFGTRRTSYSVEQGRGLSQVRAKVRNLIQVANAQRSSQAGSEVTSSNDIRAIARITCAQEELLAAVNRVLTLGVTRDLVLDKAIDPVVRESVVVSDVAWFAVDRVKHMVADERFSA